MLYQLQNTTKSYTIKSVLVQAGRSGVENLDVEILGDRADILNDFSELQLKLIL